MQCPVVHASDARFALDTAIFHECAALHPGFRASVRTFSGFQQKKLAVLNFFIARSIAAVATLSYYAEGRERLGKVYRPTRMLRDVRY
eukprot:870446-Rhodomonas_salina.2